MTRIVLVEERIDAKEGDLCVWWIRNPPNFPHYVPVATSDEAVEILNALVKADLADDSIEANVGGLEVFENSEWVEWYTEDGDGIDWEIMEDEE